MKQECAAVSAVAGMVLCGTAAGGPLVQIHHFATGFSNSNTPLTIPAIDPAGIAWHAPSGHLFIADSEIEEVSQAWSLIHKNIFEVSPRQHAVRLVRPDDPGQRRAHGHHLQHR